MDEHRSSLLCVFLYICYCMCGQRSVRAPSNLCAYVWALPLCKCNVCDRLASNVITLMHVFLIIPRTVDDLLPQQHASHLFDFNCHVALYLWHIYHKSWPWWSKIFFFFQANLNLRSKEIFFHAPNLQDYIINSTFKNSKFLNITGVLMSIGGRIRPLFVTVLYFRFYCFKFKFDDRIV